MIRDFQGEFLTDELSRKIYATDASVYQVTPEAVAYPKDENDLVALVQYAKVKNTSIVPRSGGTSLSGQCVGSGIVVDVSKYLTHILDFNLEQGWVKVQPGVILDELNRFLRPMGYQFSPNTSTSNRCTIGGMVGNNSSGSGSIKHGTTRDHCLHIRAVLSNGTIAEFYPMSSKDFSTKCRQDNLEGQLYRQLRTVLSPKDVQNNIRENYPKVGIHRRNTGYALDQLILQKPFNPDGSDFNMCSLLCGSEGTLCLFSEITLRIVPLDPPESTLIVPHFATLNEALEAVPNIMKFSPYACELMDKTILECTKANKKFAPYRSFVQGNPEALLMIEFKAEDKNSLGRLSNRFIEHLKANNIGYAYPILHGRQVRKAWDLRKAGLGLLANIPGDAKAVACIEDTAVDVNDLAKYIAEFSRLMEHHRQKCVYYAHAGAGELHLRPVLNLKSPKDVYTFRQLTEQTTRLVKKYRGSLSGEHGDGRVRSEFISILLGTKIMEILESIKSVWDPQNIFNPGKIVHPLAMDTDLRQRKNQTDPNVSTGFRFEPESSFFQSIERCNGSADCRKPFEAGGVMCPSFMASSNESWTTRARANALRQLLLSDKNLWKRQDLYDILDSCLSCKACASECPSNIDMARYKSEFLYQRKRAGIINKADKWIATMDQNYKQAYRLGAVSYKIATSKSMEQRARKEMNIHPNRSIPKLAPKTWQQWWKKSGRKNNPSENAQKIILFCDEITNYFEPDIGIAATKLFQHLGYYVLLPAVKSSARAAISKGYLEYASTAIDEIIKSFAALDSAPIVGIEPSAVLGFVDEYPDLCHNKLRQKALELKKRSFAFEDFIKNEFDNKRIREAHFDDAKRMIKVHTHCHQKALASEDNVLFCLSIPNGHQVEKIHSSCCGMAGAFGYDRKNYPLSQKIAELGLYPELRNTPEDTFVVATGSSCRHQIKDGLKRKTLHAAELLYMALI